MQSLPAVVWKKRISDVITFYAGIVEPSFADNELMKIAVASADERAAFVIAAMVRVARNLDLQRALTRVGPLIQCRLYFSELLRCLTMRKAYKPTHQGVMALLLEKEDNRAREWIRNGIDNLSVLGDDRELTFIAAAAAVWLEKDGFAAWPNIWKTMRANVKFAELLLGVYGNRRLRADVIADWLPARDLAELFRWLRLNFGVRNQPINAPAGQQFQGSILYWLQSRATDVDVIELEKLARDYPDDWWIRKALWEGRRALSERRWTPLEPTKIARVIEDRRELLIRDRDDLVEAVHFALEDLQQRLSAPGDRVKRLWNEQHHGHKLSLQPKPEEAVSSEIRLELEEILRGRGLVTALEPKLRDGQFLDIYIEAPAAPAEDGHVSVIIEVKCCWHADLEVAMEAQLACRYLKDNPAAHGIYLVPWFLCTRWNATDRRKAKSSFKSIPDAREFFTTQAANVSARTGTRISAFLLDATLPEH